MVRNRALLRQARAPPQKSLPALPNDATIDARGDEVLVEADESKQQSCTYNMQRRFVCFHRKTERQSA